MDLGLGDTDSTPRTRQLGLDLDDTNWMTPTRHHGLNTTDLATRTRQLALDNSDSTPRTDNSDSATRTLPLGLDFGLDILDSTFDSTTWTQLPGLDFLDSTTRIDNPTRQPDLDNLDSAARTRHFDNPTSATWIRQPGLDNPNTAIRTRQPRTRQPDLENPTWTARALRAPSWINLVAVEYVSPATPGFSPCNPLAYFL